MSKNEILTKLIKLGYRYTSQVHKKVVLTKVGRPRVIVELPTMSEEQLRKEITALQEALRSKTF